MIRSNPGCRSILRRAGFIERNAHLSCCDCWGRPGRAAGRADSAAARRPARDRAERRADRPRQPVRGGAAAARPGAAPSRWSRSIPNAPPFPPVPGPVEDAPLGDPALTEPLPPLSTFDVQPVAEARDARRTRARSRRRSATRSGRRGPGGDRARRPLPRPLRARGCRGRGGQRRDDRRPRRGGRGARRPPAPLGRLL